MADRIICGDALEIMAAMPDESIDLIFADPPFNVGKPYMDKRDNYREWVAAWVSECFRVLKPTGSFYHMTIINHLDWKMPLMAQHGQCVDLICWLNASPFSRGAFFRHYQPIMLYAKSGEYVFNKNAQRVRRTHIIPGKGLVEMSGAMSNMWNDIAFISGGCIRSREAILDEGSNKKAHPCQMPIALAERAILFSSNEGDLVLAPFSGSGTSAVAAIRTGRHYIGIDISPEYCDIARERIRMEQAQLKLDLTLAAGG